MWATENLSLWTYQASVIRVVDGDTLDVRVDMGFHTARTIRVRLAGVDTAEIHGVSHDSEEFEEGQTHAEFVQAWVSEGTFAHVGDYPFVVQTEKTGKYGRYIAALCRKSDLADLAESLVEEFPSVADE